MTCFSYALLLIFLSTMNLATVISVWLLDVLATRTLQKIRVLKVGLVLLITTAVMVVSFGALPVSTAVFEFSSNALNLPVETISSWQVKTEERSWLLFLSLVHVLTFSFFLVRTAHAYFSMRRLLKDSKRVVINGFNVWLNKNLIAPLSFGFIPGKIYAPADVETSLGKRKAELALAHEMAHIKNFDTSWKLVSLIVQSFLFFAPWSYVLHKKFMLEIETRCDEIARETTKSDVKEYGSFLLSMSVANSSNFICTNLIDSTIKRRIVAMKKTTVRRPMFTALSCSALILLSALTVFGMTSNLSLSEDITISSEVFYDGNLISSPVIIAKMDQEARLEIGDKDRKEVFTMALVPSAFPDEQIKLSFNVENKGAVNFKAQPYIVLRPDQKGAISVEMDSGKVLELRTIVNLQGKSDQQLR